MFTCRSTSSTTRYRSIRLSPIVEYSRLQPPVGVSAVLSPIGEGHPLRSPMRHSLGEPLPHQLADTRQAAPEAINLYSSFALDSIRASEDRSCDLSFVALNEIQSEGGDHRELSNLSAGYARLPGTF